MFRSMRRFKQQVGDDVCRKLLKEEKRAALAVNGDDGYPYALPVNYYYDEAADKIYFHGAKAGYKYDCMKRDNKVCFTVWNTGFQKPGEWPYHVTSVIVFGTVRFIEDPGETEVRCRELGLKYFPTAEEVESDIGKHIKHVQMFEITIDHMTGKLVKES